MATVSARIDDDLKVRADSVAESIGISLSSAIGIFLKRFVAEQGFPFEVKAVHYNVHSMTDSDLTELAKLGVREGTVYLFCLPLSISTRKQVFQKMTK